MSVFHPGDHGSTFGGNPLAAAIGIAALDVVIDERLAERADELGTWFMAELRKIQAPCVAAVRGKGLMIGVEIKQEFGPARPYCEALMELGILAESTTGDRSRPRRHRERHLDLGRPNREALTPAISQTAGFRIRRTESSPTTPHGSREDGRSTTIGTGALGPPPRPRSLPPPRCPLRSRSRRSCASRA
jgi:hypothetical protein